MDDTGDVVALPDTQEPRAVIEIKWLDDQAFAELGPEEGRQLAGTVLGNDTSISHIQQSASGVRADEAEPAGDQDHDVLQSSLLAALIVSKPDDQAVY
jgi:hypothetical protein